LYFFIFRVKTTFTQNRDIDIDNTKNIDNINDKKDEAKAEKGR
jgi:hypothetical protein